MGEILAQEKTAAEICRLETCYRREAGAAGKDTYGLYRIHQFDKSRRLLICANDAAESAKYHWRDPRENSEGVYASDGNSLSCCEVCTGDLGRFRRKNMISKRGCHREKAMAKRIAQVNSSISRHADLICDTKIIRRRKICSAIRWIIRLLLRREFWSLFSSLIRIKTARLLFRWFWGHIWAEWTKSRNNGFPLPREMTP